MIKVVVWNIRGLNSSDKQMEVKNLIERHNLGVCVLVETRVKKQNKDNIVSSLLPCWSYLDNYDGAENGRIWVICNPNACSVRMISSMDQAITCEFISSQATFWITAIYGHNRIMQRTQLW